LPRYRRTVRAARRRPATFAIAIATGLAGCQLLAPSGEVQCRADSDCDTRGGDFTGSVCVDQLCVSKGDRCLGHTAEVVEDRTQPLHTRLRFVNVGGTPVAGIPVLVCASKDEGCEGPVGPPVVTDAAGYAYMTIWKDFRGTIQVKNLPAGSDILKTKIHFSGRFQTDDRADRVIPPERAIHLLTRTLFGGQLGSRAALDPNAGHILAETADCDAVARAGVQVSFTTDKDAGAPFLFYFSEEGIASATATETAKDGLFGVVNVPEGPVVLEGTITASGKKLARTEIWVNKDTISNLALAPTPALP
jgi:hypothetical protein